VKRIDYDQVRTVGGHRLPTRWTMTDANDPKRRTVIEIQNLEFDIAIAPDVFSLERLRNPQ